MWSALPMIPGGLPSILGALGSPSALAALPFDTADFGAWVAHGNPWRSQAYGAHAFTLGQPCYTTLGLPWRSSHFLVQLFWGRRACMHKVLCVLLHGCTMN